MALTKVSNSMLVQPVNHNILINPSFTVNQYGDVIDHDNSTIKCGPDRWKFRGIDKVGGTMNQTTTFVAPTTGINKLLVKHRNATSHAYALQNIEAVNIQGVYGKEITFSFSYSDTGGSGIPKVLIKSYDSSDAEKILYEAMPTSLGNNRWTCTVTLSTNDGTFPDPSERGMQVVIWPNEANAAPAEWSVWETKLEVGSVATPFIARSYGEELALCQRYYEQINHETNFSFISVGVGASSAVVMAHVVYAQKRTAPSNTSDGVFVCYDGTNRAVTSQTYNHITSTRATCLFNSTGISEGRAYKVQFDSSGARNIRIDAEL